MVSTSGAHLLHEDAIKVMREQLLPLATILTPNVPEAMLLLANAGIHAEPPTSVDDLVKIAKTVQTLGPEFVLLKGGHLPLQRNGAMASVDSEKELVVDVLYGAGAYIRIDSDYQESKNTHGTGCSLACEFKRPLFLQLEHDLTPSAAIASNIANGFDIDRAVKAACRYVDAGIRTAKDIGAGNGPINHFHSVYILPFAPYVRPLQELHGFSRSIGVILSSTFLTDPMLREHGKSIRSIAFWNVLPMAHSLWNHLRTI